MLDTHWSEKLRGGLGLSFYVQMGREVTAA